MGKTHKFRVGYFQFAPVFGCVNENQAEIINYLESIDADLVVLPELPFTGYGFSNREELLSLAENPADSSAVSNRYDGLF